MARKNFLWILFLFGLSYTVFATDIVGTLHLSGQTEYINGSVYNGPANLYGYFQLSESNDCSDFVFNTTGNISTSASGRWSYLLNYTNQSKEQIYLKYNITDNLIFNESGCVMVSPAYYTNQLNQKGNYTVTNLTATSIYLTNLFFNKNSFFNILDNDTIIRANNITNWDLNAADDLDLAALDNNTVIRTSNTTWVNTIVSGINNLFKNVNFTALFSEYSATLQNESSAFKISNMTSAYPNLDTDSTDDFNFANNLSAILDNTTILRTGDVNYYNTTINRTVYFLQNGTEIFPYETGWADYIDTQYTTSSRFTALDGVQTNFPNNKGIVRDSQMPSYINETGGFYNGSHILGRNGDAYGVGIRFKSEPKAVNTNCQFFYNISGDVGLLQARLLTFPKGANVEQDVKFYAAEYTLNTWEANGAKIEVECNGGNVEFWNISYEFFLLHRANSSILFTSTTNTTALDIVNVSMLDNGSIIRNINTSWVVEQISTYTFQNISSAFNLVNYSTEYSSTGYKLENFTSNYDARNDRFLNANFTSLFNNLESALFKIGNMTSAYPNLDTDSTDDFKYENLTDLNSASTSVKFNNITTTQTNNSMGNFSIVQYNASCVGFKFGSTGGLVLSCE